MTDRIQLSVADILGPEGAIARRLKGYEERPEQLEMARAVEQAIRDPSGRLAAKIVLSVTAEAP